MFTVVVATLAVNIAANVVSPANDFANAFPKYIGFKTGGLITGILGIAIQPWRLLADPSGYIFTWLLGYSGGLGSIAGVLIADYWIVRRRELKLEDLYLADGDLSRLELARDCGHRDRLRAGVGRARRAGAETAVRLRVVRRLLRVGRRARGAVAAPAGDDASRGAVAGLRHHRVAVGIAEPGKACRGCDKGFPPWSRPLHLDILGESSIKFLHLE